MQTVTNKYRAFKRANFLQTTIGIKEIQKKVKQNIRKFVTHNSMKLIKKVQTFLHTPLEDLLIYRTIYDA